MSNTDDSRFDPRTYLTIGDEVVILATGATATVVDFAGQAVIVAIGNCSGPKYLDELAGAWTDPSTLEG